MPAAQECTRNLNIEIPAGEVEREFSRIAQTFQRRARIAGFRPGKAPLGLVRQRFQGQIREELLQTLLPAHLRAAFEREQLEPVSTPTVEDLHYHSGEPIRFKTSFEVLPDFELADYESIKVELAEPAVGEIDIDSVVERLRERYATFEPVSGEGEAAPEAAEGMRAIARTRRRAPADAEASGPAPNPSADADEQEVSIDIGGSDTLPAFSDALRGMHPGETRDFDVDYPANYPNSKLAGEAVPYSITLERLERKRLPELTEEFLKDKTGLEDEAALRARIRADLLEEGRQKARNQAEEKILDRLVELHMFPLPASLVEKQIEANVERRLRVLAMQGVDPRKVKLDWSKLRDANTPAAERQVRTALILERIGKKENIDAPEAQVEGEIQEIARDSGQSPDAVRRRLTENGAMDRIKSRVRNERVLAFLLAHATGTRVEATASGAGPEARGES